MTEIIDVTAREILDSRGNPTVEVEIMLGCGATGRLSILLEAAWPPRRCLSSLHSLPMCTSSKVRAIGT